MFYVFRLYLYSMRTIKENQFFVWEENDLTAPTMKSENSGITALKNTTSETKNVSVENVCEDTGNRKEWKRNCPKCGRESIYISKKGYIYAQNHKSLCKNCRFDISHPKLEKICPNCGNLITYSNKGALESALKFNSWCKKCWKQKRKTSRFSELQRECPKCNKKIFYSSKNSFSNATKYNHLCNTCKILGIKLKPWSNEQKQCFSKKFSGKNNPFYGKHHAREKRKYWSKIRTGRILSEKTKKLLIEQRSCELYRQKQREIRLKQILELGCWISYNQNACKYFDKLNKENKWKLQHAMNGGEIICIGYSLDAYDKNKNIVVEYDERKHYTGGKLKIKDVDRMNRIKKHLQCRFFRYNEKIKELKEY